MPPIGKARRSISPPTAASSLRAIAALTELGVEGAIVGTALYEGAFTLEEALAEVGR